MCDGKTPPFLRPAVEDQSAPIPEEITSELGRVIIPNLAGLKVAAKFLSVHGTHSEESSPQSLPLPDFLRSS